MKDGSSFFAGRFKFIVSIKLGLNKHKTTQNVREMANKLS